MEKRLALACVKRLDEVRRLAARSFGRRADGTTSYEAAVGLATAPPGEIPPVYREGTTHVRDELANGAFLASHAAKPLSVESVIWEAVRAAEVDLIRLIRALARVRDDTSRTVCLSIADRFFLVDPEARDNAIDEVFDRLVSGFQEYSWVPTVSRYRDK